jgi:hypothetical protein
VQNLDQDFDQILLLQQIASSQTLTGKSVDERHCVLKHFAASVKQFINDDWI